LLRTLRDVSNHGTSFEDRIERPYSTLGAKMVTSADAMPVEYSRILAEHMQRALARALDVSHMGEIEVGETRARSVQHVYLQ